MSPTHATTFHSHGTAYVSIFSKHDVVRVPVPNAKHVCGHAVASTRFGEHIHSLVQTEEMKGMGHMRTIECNASLSPQKTHTGTAQCMHRSTQCMYVQYMIALFISGV